MKRFTAIILTGILAALLAICTAPSAVAVQIEEEPMYQQKNRMSDEEFFGKWNEETQTWDIEGKINNDYQNNRGGKATDPQYARLINNASTDNTYMVALGSGPSIIEASYGHWYTNTIEARVASQAGKGSFDYYQYDTESKITEVKTGPPTYNGNGTTIHSLAFGFANESAK